VRLVGRDQRPTQPQRARRAQPLVEGVDVEGEGLAARAELDKPFPVLGADLLMAGTAEGLEGAGGVAGGGAGAARVRGRRGRGRGLVLVPAGALCFLVLVVRGGVVAVVAERNGSGPRQEAPASTIRRCCGRRELR